MKNLLVYYDPDLTTKIDDIPIPEYGSNEILIKVHVAGSNPKDWKHPMPAYFSGRVNQGNDAAGIVSAIGSSVRNFRPGDRVAGFHQMNVPKGTYAEYTVCPAQTVFHIPKSMSFEEAATIPLACYTAAVGLYRNLGLPLPFGRADEKAGIERRSLVINGASSAVGAYALKLAQLNPSIGPIIATAGSGASFVREISNPSNVNIVDYRSKTIVSDIETALGGPDAKAAYVFDAANSDASVVYLTSVLAPNGRYTCTQGVSGGIYGESTQKSTLEKWGGWWEQIWVGSVHDDKPAGGILFGGVMSRILEMLLAEGNFSGHPYEVVEGGLNGVLGALIKLRDRKGGNEKFVYRIAETEGVET